MSQVRTHKFKRAQASFAINDEVVSLGAELTEQLDSVVRERRTRIKDLGLDGIGCLCVAIALGCSFPHGELTISTALD